MKIFQTTVYASHSPILIILDKCEMCIYTTLVSNSSAIAIKRRLVLIIIKCFLKCMHSILAKLRTLPDKIIAVAYATFWPKKSQRANQKHKIC